jgi:hypothetical protein
LTTEQYLGSRNIQRAIFNNINIIANSLTNTPESPTDGEEKTINPVVDNSLVSGSLFNFLLQDRLPETAAGGKEIIYELLDTKIVMRVMPSACHDYTAASFTEDLQVVLVC